MVFFGSAFSAPACRAMRSRVRHTSASSACTSTNLSTQRPASLRAALEAAPPSSWRCSAWMASSQCFTGAQSPAGASCRASFCRGRSASCPHWMPSLRSPPPLRRAFLLPRFCRAFLRLLHSRVARPAAAAGLEGEWHSCQSSFRPQVECYKVAALSGTDAKAAAGGGADGGALQAFWRVTIGEPALDMALARLTSTQACSDLLISSYYPAPSCVFPLQLLLCTAAALHRCVQMQCGH